MFLINIFQVLKCPNPDPTELSNQNIRIFYSLMICVLIVRDFLLQRFHNEVIGTSMLSMYPSFIICYQILLIICSLSYQIVVIGYATMCVQWDGGYIFSYAIIIESSFIFLVYGLYYLKVSVRYGRIISASLCCAEMVSGYSEVTNEKYLTLMRRLSYVVEVWHCFFRFIFSVAFICGILDIVSGNLKNYYFEGEDMSHPLLKRRQ